VFGNKAGVGARGGSGFYQLRLVHAEPSRTLNQPSLRRTGTPCRIAREALVLPLCRLSWLKRITWRVHLNSSLKMFLLCSNSIPKEGRKAAPSTNSRNQLHDYYNH